MGISVPGNAAIDPRVWNFHCRGLPFLFKKRVHSLARFRLRAGHRLNKVNEPQSNDTRYIAKCGVFSSV